MDGPTTGEMSPPAVGPTRSTRRLQVVELGVQPYGVTLELQRELARARITGELSHDTLLLVQHPPVVTLGRASRDGHVTASPALLAARGVATFEVERGGDVTFHGPGQLVGYPIMDLANHRKDLHWYLRTVEEALIRGVAPFGIRGTRNPGYTGVWVGGDAGGDTAAGLQPPPRKLASIGVHARGWVTWHGFALNVENDLSYFDLIVPCGIAGVSMTSVKRETGRRSPSFDIVSESVARAMGEAFGVDVMEAGPGDLPAADRHMRH